MQNINGAIEIYGNAQYFYHFFYDLFLFPINTFSGLFNIFFLFCFFPTLAHWIFYSPLYPFRLVFICVFPLRQPRHNQVLL